MGGTYQDALTVPLDIMSRYIAFADIEEMVKQKEAEANAQPQ